jgi:hypothetical protein
VGLCSVFHSSFVSFLFAEEGRGVGGGVGWGGRVGFGVVVGGVGARVGAWGVCCAGGCVGDLVVLRRWKGLGKQSWVAAGRCILA